MRRETLCLVEFFFNKMWNLKTEKYIQTYMSEELYYINGTFKALSD